MARFQITRRQKNVARLMREKKSMQRDRLKALKGPSKRANKAV